MSGIRLVHDVIDAQLVDRSHRKIGRVDALVLELRDGAPPRVAAILTGGPARAARIGRWAMWLARALHALGRARRPGVDRIPFRKVRCVADTIQVDVDRHDLESHHLEDWLADHVICRIPGAGARKQ